MICVRGRLDALQGIVSHYGSLLGNSIGLITDCLLWYEGRAINLQEFG